MPILTAADNLLLGSTPLNRVYAGATKVWPPNYLNAEVGTVSSPDPGPPLPTQCVFVFRVLGTTTVLGSLCSQYEVDPQRSWLIRRNQTNGAFTVNLVPSAGTAASSKAMVTSTPYTPPTTVPETLAVSIDQSVASARDLAHQRRWGVGGRCCDHDGSDRTDLRFQHGDPHRFVLGQRHSVDGAHLLDRAARTDSTRRLGRSVGGSTLRRSRGPAPVGPMRVAGCGR